jgi:hypothetical protein
VSNTVPVLAGMVTAPGPVNTIIDGPVAACQRAVAAIVIRCGASHLGRIVKHR